MSDTMKAQREKLAEVALGDPKVLEGLVAQMEGASRRGRQNAASALSIVAASSPETLAPHIDAVIDALERPEAQTRWECLDILTSLVPSNSDACESALAGAESALFDEDSGPLRLAAVRFLCRFGASSKTRSRQVWPLLDEAVQCYHGDLEFQDMLVAIIGFSENDLDMEVAAQLKARMEFDARNAKGVLKKRAQHIIDNLDAE